jgi:hypothetical protein
MKDYSLQKAEISFAGKLILFVLPYFCQNYLEMETTKKSTRLYWILFFVSIIASVLSIKLVEDIARWFFHLMLPSLPSLWI